MQNLIYYLVTVLIWGSTWFAIKFQLDAAAVPVSLYWRFGIAAVVLFAYCTYKRLPIRFAPYEHAFMALQGLCLFSVNYLLFYWCTNYITSGLVAVIFSTVIVMNILNSALFLKKSIEPVVVAGAMVGLTGITLVFWSDVSSIEAQNTSGAIGKGIMLGLVATLSASLGNILSARNQGLGLPVIQTNTFGMLYGALFMFGYSILTSAEHSINWNLSYAVSLLYLAIPGSIFAFGAYLSLIGRIGADRAAYATVLFPVVALIISSMFEGFTFTATSVVGIGLVLFGNSLVLGRGFLNKRLQPKKESGV